jgi:threonine dehydrogenase-like Zn-dependent dehydrogenase
MKAIAVLPGTKNSIHLRDVPDPVVEDVPDGRGVLVRVLRVGVDGTDREINAAEYGAAPPGDDYLILGHESFGQILNADLVGAIGARYISTQDESLSQASARYGPFDYIMEGTGFSPLVFEAMEVLGKNGVLAQVSVTGGDRTVEVPADRINQGFVLGNKVAFGSVNASRDDFDRGVRFLTQAEATYPGWLARLLTHPVRGLERCEQLMETLTTARDAIKVYCEVASVPPE